jgi:hypothetical protein
VQRFILNNNIFVVKKKIQKAQKIKFKLKKKELKLIKVKDLILELGVGFKPCLVLYQSS